MTAALARLGHAAHTRRTIFRGVRARLFGGYAALVCVLLVGLSAAYSSTQVLRTNFTHTVETVDAVSTTAAQITKLLDDQETGVRGYLLTGDTQFLQPYDAAARTLPALNRRASTLLDTDAPGRALLAAMQRDERAWQSWVAPYPRRIPAQTRAATAFMADTLHGKALFDRFRQSSDRLSAYLDARRATDFQQSIDATQRTGGILFWILIGAIILVIAIAWLTTHAITRSLDQLGRVALAIGRGRLDQPIAVSGPVELARLGGSMDHMRRQLVAQREIAEILGSSLHLESIWARFAEAARTQVPFDQCRLSAVSEDGGTMTTLFVEGVARDRVGATHERSAATSGLAQPTQQFVLFPDLADLPPEARFDDALAGMRDGMRSAAIVPLRVQGRLVGRLDLASTRTHAFTEELLGPILALAPLVGAAMENARLYAALGEANSALARASQVKSDFLASMSHELRTPLNAIIGFSEVLQDMSFGPLNERQQHYVANVLESGRHQLRLVNDILDLSKVEAGRMELHPRDLDLHALLREAALTLLPLARQKGIALETEVGDDALLVHADRQRTLQILYNLLSNAVKFTPGGGAVRVSTRVRPRDIAVAVADTGIGIALEDQARLFEEFAQVDNPLAHDQQGTGLGLALTRRLVELQGGTIAVESTPGQGSSFTFTVPRVREQPQESGAGGDVLVVEDHPPAQDLMRLYLGEAGYGVQVVQHLHEVVPEAVRLHPVAITLDVLVGGGTAWPVLRQLKSEAETKDIPVVIVSVVDDGQAAGFALGASDYLVKPVSRQELRHALDRAVGERKPISVLAVDDDPAALEMIAAALEGGPYTLARATGGAEALALLRQQRPDIIIADLMMTPMSGFDLIDALAAGDVTCAIPIIVLTARDVTAEDIARLNGSVTVTLPKTGLRREHLLRELRRALRTNQVGDPSHAA